MFRAHLDIYRDLNIVMKSKCGCQTKSRQNEFVIQVYVKNVNLIAF